MAEEKTRHSNPQGESWQPGREPRHATAIGDPSRAPVAVYLGNTAMERLEGFLAERSRASVLGLLLGHPLQSETRRFILVSEVLGPIYTRRSSGLASELFTPQDLLSMEKAWESEYPETTVVGWFYAGPHEEGVSLSPAQRRTHERYFTAPWQITLTIDTERGASRLYRWEGESLRPCDDFYVWHTGREPVSALIGGAPSAASALAAALAAGSEESEPPAYAEESREVPDDAPLRARSRPRMSWLQRLRALWPGVLLLWALLPAAPGSIGWVQSLHAHQRDELHRLEAELYKLQEETEALAALRETAARAVQAAAATASPLAAQPVANSSPREPAQPQEAEARSPASGQRTPVAAITTPPAPAPTPKPASTLPSAAEESMELKGAATSYVIQPGDTMWRISGTLLGDPRSFRSLAEANDIEDPDRIYPGQRLRIPD